jgi:hypothetical protein
MDRIDKKIKRVMTRFVQKNTFPSYSNILLILQNIDYKYHHLFTNFMYILTKKIYENPENKKLIIHLGKKIVQLKGLHMLSLCNLVLSLVYDKSNKEIVYTYGRRIEFILSEGIDGYQA